MQRPSETPDDGGSALFELARVMGNSVVEIGETYRHLAHDSEARIRERLELRGSRSDVLGTPDRGGEV
jgi:hypothetical protein